MSHPPALIIHGHFYQPPRENPWTERVDRESSAAPFHDWNERICSECYRPNGWARIYDERGRVRDIVNNYERLSFNVGPTLASWLQRHQPSTYRRILVADRDSATARGGHGNAIAQGFNHAILPLCNDHDLRTQVRWGLADFRHRHGRDAEALWMPETACDERTLAVLIEEGMRYALLAPGQAARVRDPKGRWHDVAGGRIDPRRPYRWTHPRDPSRSIALFFYDGAISRSIAFEGALSSSSRLLDRFEAAGAGEGRLIHAATDGESYGHHFKFGDRCVAHALSQEAQRRGWWVTNYGELLDHHPPTWEVEIAKGEEGRGTSWSCAHGVGRWYRDCGCHTGGEPGWDQRWRGPLREALDQLRDEAAILFETRLGEHTEDPWAIRDAYVELLLERRLDPETFFRRQLGAPLGQALPETLRLLEAQRASMLMYTSCGWFFNDLSGIETLQVLRYAGQLVDHLQALGVEGVEARFLEALAEAKSNLSDAGTGADLYRREVVPRRVDRRGLAAHIALSGLLQAQDDEGEVASHRYQRHEHRQGQRTRWSIATSRVVLTDPRVAESSSFSSCAVQLGDVDLHCVLRQGLDAEAHAAATKPIWEAFARGSLLTVLRVAEEAFGPDDFGLEHVLQEDRDALSETIFARSRPRYAAQYEAMYREASTTVQRFVDTGLPVPRELVTATELGLAYRFDECFDEAPVTGFDRAQYETALAIAAEARHLGCRLRTDAAHRHLAAKLIALVTRVCAGEADEQYSGSSGPAEAAMELLEVARELGVELDRARSQELVYEALVRGDRDVSVRGLGEALGLAV